MTLVQPGPIEGERYSPSFAPGSATALNVLIMTSTDLDISSATALNMTSKDTHPSCHWQSSCQRS